jgi:hypothetical protein
VYNVATAELEMKISAEGFNVEKLTQALRIGVAGIISIYVAGLFKLPQGSIGRPSAPLWSWGLT